MNLKAGTVLVCSSFVVATGLAACSRADSSGPCFLKARAAVVPRDVPMGQALGWDSDMLVLRNDDDRDWRDVQIAVYGFKPYQGNKPTGAYTFKTDRVPAGGFSSFPLKDFKNPGGQTWVSMTMRAEDVEVRATAGGASCKTENLRVGAEK